MRSIFDFIPDSGRSFIILSQKKIWGPVYYFIDTSIPDKGRHIFDKIAFFEKKYEKVKILEKS